jgi:GT2 family glycosyltransferase
LIGADARPDITVVIVAWNTRELLMRCLAAIDRHMPARRSIEIVVVDNGSADGTASAIQRERPDVHLIANDRNLGYTRANNQGMAVARGHYLLLINSDAFVTDGACERMLALAEGEPGAGAIGPRLVYGDGRWQRWTAGRAPSLRSVANYYLFLERLAPGRAAFAGVYLGDDTREARTVDWVSSACMLVRAEAIREIGGMDERIFTYMDDVDLCQRLRDHGWTVRYCPQAEVIHLMGGSAAPSVASEAALRSFNGYFARLHGPFALALLRVLQLVGFGLRTVAYGAAAVVKRKPEMRARAGAHWRSLRFALLEGGQR